ncbi:MAG: DUF3109 family protein [Bacteroidetes bacterium]|nr:DUF3109 family protein [Bacteroidota bacterium]
MLKIEDFHIDPLIAEIKFACDLEKCKGACCTFPGGRGAPLKDEEAALIEKYYPAIKNLLPEEHRKTIEQYGLVEGGPGYFATQCVDGKACVFVYYQNGIAKCAFEKAYREGTINWQKPLSCHLFPIRINEQTAQMQFEYFQECGPALERGKRENIQLLDFVDEPLSRVFSKEERETLKEKL